MEVRRRDFDTPAGKLEGIQIECPWFNVVWVAGRRGMVSCAAINAEACQRFEVPCAIASSSPQEPIRTIEDLVSRKVKAANPAAEALGIAPGMPVWDALALLA